MDHVERIKDAEFLADLPKAVTPEILAFAAELGAVAPPVYLPLTPRYFSRFGGCYENARLVADYEGGKPRCGWMIWDQGGAYLVAEHHAVVEHEDGRLEDVTPQVGTMAVLFVPTDDARPSATLPCQYKALVTDPLIKEVIKYKEAGEALGMEAVGSAAWYRLDELSTNALRAYVRKVAARKSAAEKEARKKSRKVEKKARKKNRKR